MSMKPLLFLLLAAGALRAATVDAPSEISAVTVYPDRARITREAQVTVPEGESVIRFGGLPEELEDSSVQAGGVGAGVKILGLEIRTKYSEEVANEQVRALQAQLQTVTDAERELAGKIEDIDKQKSFLNRVRDGMALTDKTDQTPPQGVEKVKALYDFYAGEIVRLSKEAIAADMARRDLQPKKEALLAELKRLEGSEAKAQKEVLVAVKAGSGAPARLTLSYNMMNASWQPLYDARVNTKDGAIDLGYFGVVRQQTGEDWRDAKLSLSTARPSEGARMPELSPWWLRELVVRPQARATFGYSAEASDRERDNAMVVAPAPAPLAKVETVDFETAEIDSGGISTVFDIKIPATIPSDGEPHRVAITTQKFKGELEYVTTPKLEELVYLKTKLTNTSDAPILGGEVNLFRDGDFVGQSTVNFIAQGAEFDFFLGVDDGVKVTRKTLVDKSAEGGLLQKRKGVTRKYETTVENFRDKPAKVTVLDQLPVTQDTSIEVSGVKLTPAPTTQEKETGKLSWQFPLAPKEKKIITEEFTINWPADKQIDGL